MTIECSDRKIRVIVVAGPGDRYRTEVLFLLDRLGIEHTLCPNVYAALGEIVCSNGSDKLIVVGPLEKLCRDQRRFFVITSEKDVKCCCITSGAKIGIAKCISDALDIGAAIAGDTDELVMNLENIVGEFLEDQIHRTLPEEVTPNRTIDPAEGALSQAELNALLGDR